MSDAQITLSEDRLDAKLLGLELRLVDRITQALDAKADQKVVEEHDKRITSLEQSRAAREHLAPEVQELGKRVTKLERFRYAIPSAAVVSASTAVGLLLYYVH